MTDNSKIRHSRTHTPHSASVFIYLSFPCYPFCFSLLIPQEYSAAFSSAIAPLSAPSRTLPAFRFGIYLLFFPLLSFCFFLFLANTARVLRGVLVPNSAVIRALADTPRIPLRYLFTFLSPVIFFLFPLSFCATRPRSPRLPRCRRQRACPRAPYSAYLRRRHGLRHSRALRPASQRGGRKPLLAKCSRP